MQGSRKAHNSESTLDITCSLNHEVRRLPDQCFPMLPLASPRGIPMDCCEGIRNATGSESLI